MKLPRALIALILSYTASTDLATLHLIKDYGPFLTKLIEEEIFTRPYSVWQYESEEKVVHTLLSDCTSDNWFQYYGMYALRSDYQVQIYFDFSSATDLFDNEHLPFLAQLDLAKIVYYDTPTKMIIYLTSTHELRVFKDGHDELILAEVVCASWEKGCYEITVVTRRKVMRFDVESEIKKIESYPNPIGDQCTDVGYISLRFCVCVALLDEDEILRIYLLPEMSLRFTIAGVKGIATVSGHLGYTNTEKTKVFTLDGNVSERTGYISANAWMLAEESFLTPALNLSISDGAVILRTFDQTIAALLDKDYVYLKLDQYRSDK